MKRKLAFFLGFFMMVFTSVSVQAEKGETETEAWINPYEEGGEFHNMKIIYVGNGRMETLEAKDVSNWVRTYADGHWDIDDEKMREYMDHLQDIYNTTQYDKYLDGTMGDQIVLTKGNYGWKIDRSTEVSELSEMLRNNGLTVHNLHYSQKAENMDPNRDYGDSYVEIDLTRQILWLYEEGRVTLISNIVSGLMNTDRQTPGGAYAVSYKQAPAVLRGEDYETNVSYWMPFNGGIGLHDATWQSSFGGDACYYRGSHGCINLPLEIAATIYDRIEKGFPVLCYYSNPEDE